MIFWQSPHARESGHTAEEWSIEPASHTCTSSGHESRVAVSRVFSWQDVLVAYCRAFGLQEVDVNNNNPRNGLLLTKKIEEAFDVKHVCFLYNPISQQLIFKVLNPDLMNVKIHPYYGETFATILSVLKRRACIWDAITSVRGRGLFKTMQISSCLFSRL